MKRLDAGTSGTRPSGEGPDWGALNMGQPWQALIEILAGASRPRPVQILALGEQRALEHRRNLIVAAPTNAGKSLVGLLVLLQAVRNDLRAVLLEPLRALAREKYDELRGACPRLAQALGRAVTVRITTGDYRLDQETFSSPPPDRGEVIVATPERFDALLRRPGNARWLESVGCVCADEAHLISSPRRGLTLEYVLTALKSLPASPRLVLLSASVGGLDRARDWLSPCDVVRVTDRQPPLRKEVWELDGQQDEDSADGLVRTFAQEVLQDRAAQLLVFVYQTRSAERLARELKGPLATLAGQDGPLAYHAQMSPAQRESARAAFLGGRCRCLVTTTALGLGVNLPATHVLVRDTTFPGAGRVTVPDLLQMMGRAGRGDREGRSVALVRPRDGWSAGELAAGLRQERLPELTSVFEQATTRGRGAARTPDLAPSLLAGPVLAQLVRHQEHGLSAQELGAFFAQSLGGRAAADHVAALLAWLAEPPRVLAYCDEQGRYRPTVLGQRAAQGVLPLELAAGVGQLLRDLLSVDGNDTHLSGWQKLDHLLVLELLNPRGLLGRRFSDELASQVDGWVEGHPGWPSLLYREWLRGVAGSSRAAEVLGSLGIPVGGSGAEGARQLAYSALFRSAVLVERALGRPPAEVERRWRITGLEGAEERWRDDTLWLLSGLSGLLDIRCLYHHLREECAADSSRVRRVKGILGRMRSGLCDLREDLQYCSPLGPMLKSLRRTRQTRQGGSVGIRTIRRLEGAGVRTVADLARLSVEDLVRLEIRRPLAEQIRAYVKRRLA